MVNTWSCIKELLLCFWALKLDWLLWNNYPLPDSVQLDLLFIPPPTYYLIHQQLSVHNRTSCCHPSPGQLVVPLSQMVNMRLYLAAAFCSTVFFQLEACSMPPGLEGAPASIPAKTLSPMPNLLLLLHLNLVLLWLKLLCFLQTILFGWGPQTLHDVCDENNQKYDNDFWFFLRWGRWGDYAKTKNL